MIEKLHYWTHKILPLVYDDSLSYYEVLAKIRAKLNEVIDFIGDNFAENIKKVISKAFIDVIYEEESETINIFLNTEDM